MGNKKKLDDLPPSENKEFWGDAEIHTGITPHSELSEDGHHFIRVAGNEAQCTKCHWGFYLDPGDYVEDGHLYTAKKKFII